MESRDRTKGWVFHLGSCRLKRELDQELECKKSRAQSRGTDQWPSEMARKAVNSKRGLWGATPVFLVPECQQKLTLNPTAATNLLKNKIQLSKFEDLIGSIR